MTVAAWTYNNYYTCSQLHQRIKGTARVWWFAYNYIATGCCYGNRQATRQLELSTAVLSDYTKLACVYLIKPLHWALTMTYIIYVYWSEHNIMISCNYIFSFCFAASCNPTSNFGCNDGTCISSYLRCDGYSQCADYSDEATCAYTSKYNSGVRCLALQGLRLANHLGYGRATGMLPLERYRGFQAL